MMDIKTKIIRKCLREMDGGVHGALIKGEIFFFKHPEATYYDNIQNM